MTSKSVAPEQAQVAREIVKRLLRERFDGNREELAKMMGIKLPTLSDIINGHKGVGGKSLSGLERVLPGAAGAVTSGKMELVEQAFAVPRAPLQTFEPDAERPGEAELEIDEDDVENARGRAKHELIKDGFDPKVASEAVDRIAFDHSDWRDYYHAAKDAIRKATRPAKTVSERPGELGVLRHGSVAADLQATVDNAQSLAKQKGEHGRKDTPSGRKIRRAQ